MTFRVNGRNNLDTDRNVKSNKSDETNKTDEINEKDDSKKSKKPSLSKIDENPLKQNGSNLTAGGHMSSINRNASTKNINTSNVNAQINQAKSQIASVNAEGSRANAQCKTYSASTKQQIQIIRGQTALAAGAKSDIEDGQESIEKVDDDLKENTSAQNSYYNQIQKDTTARDALIDQALSLASEFGNFSTVEEFIAFANNILGKDFNDDKLNELKEIQIKRDNAQQELNSLDPTDEANKTRIEELRAEIAGYDEQLSYTDTEGNSIDKIALAKALSSVTGLQTQIASYNDSIANNQAKLTVVQDEATELESTRDMYVGGVQHAGGIMASADATIIISFFLMVE